MVSHKLKNRIIRKLIKVNTYGLNNSTYSREQATEFVKKLFLHIDQISIKSSIRYNKKYRKQHTKCINPTICLRCRKNGRLKLMYFENIKTRTLHSFYLRVDHRDSKNSNRCYACYYKKKQVLESEELTKILNNEKEKILSQE